MQKSGKNTIRDKVWMSEIERENCEGRERERKWVINCVTQKLDKKSRGEEEENNKEKS